MKTARSASPTPPGARSYRACAPIRRTRSPSTRKTCRSMRISAPAQDIVAPADRSGVGVTLAVRTDASPAVLVLTGADGAPIPAGSQGKLEGGEDFFVGYDGRAFVKGLAAQNSISVALANGECRASFAYAARPNEQVTI